MANVDSAPTNYYASTGVMLFIYTYRWLDAGHSRTGTFSWQVRTITRGISQVVSGTECIFSAVLDIKKSIFISVFFINLPNTGTVEHTHHNNTANISTKWCNNKVLVSSYKVLKVQSFSLDTGPQLFCYLFIVLSTIQCLKLAQKIAVRVC